MRISGTEPSSVILSQTCRRRRRQKQFRSIYMGASLALCGEKTAIWPAYGRAENGRLAFVFQFPADATRNVRWTAEQSLATDSKVRHVMEKLFGTRCKACNNFAKFSCWGQVPNTAIWIPSNSKHNFDFHSRVVPGNCWGIYGLSYYLPYWLKWMAGYRKRVSDSVSSLSKEASLCVSCASCSSCNTSIESRIRLSVDSDIRTTFLSTLLTKYVLLSVLSVSTTTDFRLPLPRPLPPPLDLDAFG